MAIKYLIITGNPKQVSYGDIEERGMIRTRQRRPTTGDNATDKKQTNSKLKKVNNHNGTIYIIIIQIKLSKLRPYSTIIALYFQNANLQGMFLFLTCWTSLLHLTLYIGSSQLKIQKSFKDSSSSSAL